MQREHVRLHRSLAVLGPPRRFQLMLLLLSGVERSVSQLARAVRLSQSCTTRHLQALERAGLVKGTRDGKRVVFRPAPRDATARGVLASLARTAVEELTLAGIAAGAVPVASTADRDPAPDEALADAPRARIARAIRRARPHPPAAGAREPREWREPATVEVAPPRSEPAGPGAPGGPGAAPAPAFGSALAVAAGRIAPQFQLAGDPEPSVPESPPHAEPESGNNDARDDAPPRWHVSNIEDYLL